MPWLGGDTTCRFKAEFDNTDNLPPFTQRQDSILAAAHGPVTVKHGQSVAFRAGRLVHLFPGFHAERGSLFYARVADCAECTRPQVTIESRRQKCATDLTAKVVGGKPPYSYRWSGGHGTSPTIEFTGRAQETITVVVTDAAGLSQTAIITVEPHFSGPFPDNTGTSYLTAPPGMSKSKPPGHLRSRMSVYHADPPNIPDITTLNPAYNAYRFQLQIYDGWGNLIYVQNGESDTGFANGAIYWEGYTNVPWGNRDFTELVYDRQLKPNSANKVQIGVYNWQVVLFNCRRPNGERVEPFGGPGSVTVVD